MLMDLAEASFVAKSLFEGILSAVFWLISRGFFYLLFIMLNTQERMKNTRFAATTVGPIGIANASDITVPINAQDADIIAAAMVTFLKVLNSLIEDNAGNVIRADAKSAPMVFIVTTMTVAAMMAINVLYTSARVPVADAKSSSKAVLVLLRGVRVKAEKSSSSAA